MPYDKNVKLMDEKIFKIFRLKFFQNLCLYFSAGLVHVQVMVVPQTVGIIRRLDPSIPQLIHLSHPDLNLWLEKGIHFRPTKLSFCSLSIQFK